MENIDYQALEKEVIAILDKNRVSTLATSANNRVTARAMGYASDDLKIYFQSDKAFMKVGQIKENPNVAVCVGNLQVEATAKLKGHPFDQENKDFVRVFKEKNPACFDAFTHIKSVIVIEVDPHFCVLWKSDGQRSFRDFLEIRNHKAYREYYSTERV